MILAGKSCASVDEPVRGWFNFSATRYEEQEETVQGIFTEMQAEVKPLGRELLDLEERLDRAFRDEAIDEDSLAQLTEESAAVEGSLREAHLSAHLKTRDILSPEQVEEYDRLRGYSERDATNESE